MITTTARRAALAAILVACAAMLAWAITSLWPQPATPAVGDIPILAAGGEAGEPVTITFAANRVQRGRFEPLIADFQAAHPSITVQFVELDESGGYDPRQLAAAADSSLVHVGLPGTSHAGLFLDLQPLLEAGLSQVAGEAWPGLLAGCQEGGLTLGLPAGVAPDLVFFDREAFTAAGVAPPQPGWTWDEFRLTAQALAQRQGDEVVHFGFVGNGAAFDLFAPLADRAVLQLGGLESLAGQIGWYFDLIATGAVPSPDPGGDPLARDASLIANRQAAMWLDSLENLAWRRQTLGPQVGVAPLPVPPGEPTAASNPAAAACLAISAGSTHRQAAWEWLQFLAASDVLAQDGLIPARIAAAEASPAWAELGTEAQTAVRAALEHAWYGGQEPAGLQAVRQAFERAEVGQASLSSELATLVLPDSSPPPHQTPVPVAPPQPTSLPGQVESVAYFANMFAHLDSRGIAALAEAFNQDYPAISVRVETTLPDSGPFNLADMADRYDCLVWPGHLVPEFLDSYLPLDPLLAIAPPGLLDDLSPYLLDAYRLDGELYALPASSQPMVIYYNADLLDRLRLPAPQPGWTAGDFIQLATQAASGEGPEHVYGVVPFSIDPLSLLMAVRGASWYAPEAGLPTANLEDESVVQAVAWLQEMVRLGVIPPVFGESAPMQAENLVTSGRAALWIGYAGLLGGFTEGKPPPFRIGVAPPPSSPVPLPPPLVNGMYVSRHAAQPQACLSWLAFLSEQPAAFSGVPARRSVAESPAWEAQVGVQVAGAYRAALEQPLLSQPPDPNQLGWLVSAVAQVAAGQDPASALAEAQRKADDYQACLVAALDQGLEQRQACAGQTP